MGLRRSFKPTNILINSNFTLDSNSDGLADNLTAVTAGTFSLSNGVQSFTATALNGNLAFTPTVVNGHKYYGVGWIKASGSPVRLRLAGNVTAIEITHSGSGNFERLSVVTVATANGVTNLKANDARASNWNQIQIKEFILIDLTTILPPDILALSDANLKVWCDLNIPTWFDSTMSGGSMSGMGGLK